MARASRHIEKYLLPGEQLISTTRIHRASLISPVVSYVVLASLLVLGVGFIVGVFAIAFLGLAAFWGFEKLTACLSTTFGLTDKRILLKADGLVSVYLEEIPLARVVALGVQQGLGGKMFGYGTLWLTAQGTGGRACQNVEDPFTFHKHMQEQVAAHQQSGVGNPPRSNPPETAIRAGRPDN